MGIRMKQIIAFLLSFAVSACVQNTQDISNNKPYILSRQQLAQVQQGVGQSTGLPNLLLVSHVAASINNDQVVTVCGVASLDKNFESGSAFIGIIGPTGFSVAYMANDLSSQRAVYTQCDKSGSSISASGSNASQAQSQEVKSLIGKYKSQDDLCRGESSDKAIATCDLRNETAKQLNQLGVCLGKVGQPSYHHKWHTCEANSIGAQ